MVYTELVNGASRMGGWYSSLWVCYPLHIPSNTWSRYEKEENFRRRINGIHAAYISIDNCLCFYITR